MTRGFTAEDRPRSDDDADVAVFEDAYVIRATDAALFVSLEATHEREPLWIPKSVVHDDSDVFDASSNRSGKLIVKGWFARKEGLIE